MSVIVLDFVWTFFWEIFNNWSILIKWYSNHFGIFSPFLFGALSLGCALFLNSLAAGFFLDWVRLTGPINWCLFSFWLGLDVLWVVGMVSLGCFLQLNCFLSIYLSILLIFLTQKISRFPSLQLSVLTLIVLRCIVAMHFLCPKIIVLLCNQGAVWEYFLATGSLHLFGTVFQSSIRSLKMW